MAAASPFPNPPPPRASRRPPAGPARVRKSAAFELHIDPFHQAAQVCPGSFGQMPQGHFQVVPAVLDLDAGTLAGAGQLSSRLLECPLELAEGIGNRVRPEVLGLNTAYRRPSPSRCTRVSTDRHVPGRLLPLSADGRGTPTRHRPFGSEPCRHPATARALGGGRRTRPRLTERPAGEQPAGRLTARGERAGSAGGGRRCGRRARPVRCGRRVTARVRAAARGSPLRCTREW